MKILNTILMAIFCIMFYSCEPASYVKLVKDRVKNTETYHLSFNKYTTSKIRKDRQKFSIQFMKTNIKEGMVDIFISTDRYPTEAEFSEEAYLLSSREKVQVVLENIKQVAIREDQIINGTNTTYQTVISHVPVTTTVQKTVNDVPVTETKTDIQEVRSEVPVQNNYQRITQSNYISEKMLISVPKDTLENLCKYTSFTIRIYNKENDFWNIDFNNYDYADIKNLLNNKVNPYNISHN